MKKYLILFFICISCDDGGVVENTEGVLGYSVYGNCDLYQKIPLIIDPDFTDDQIDKIRDGARYWEDAVGIDFGGLPISENNCSRESGVPGCIIKADKCFKDDGAPYPEIFIYMNIIIEGNYPLDKIVAHEIGHYIGLVHVKDTQSIMYYAVGGGETEKYQISKFDIELYEQVCIYGNLN
jgi:hypothetical protein